MKTKVLPRSFVERRLHSLLGIWLVVYLIEHLIVNSQAALFIGDNGNAFVKLVNGIHNLPYLPVIEITLLALPIIIHGVLGIQYLLRSKFNSFSGGSKTPHLSYSRNRAFTWQRLTAWVLLVGIILHVIQMRFIDYPTTVHNGIKQNFHMVRLNQDPGLYRVASRLGATIYDKNSIDHLKQIPLSSAKEINHQQSKTYLLEQQDIELQDNFISGLKSKSLTSNQVIAVSQEFGVAILLTVRDTFKSPLMIALYSIFVLMTCYHAFNGLWTASITWGVNLTTHSQKVMLGTVWFLMILVALLGLTAIWGTYWINLRY